MALPLPDSPENCVVITFQANIEGYAAISKMIPAETVLKILNEVATAQAINESGSTTLKYSGLADWFVQTMAPAFRALCPVTTETITEEEAAIISQIATLQKQKDAIRANKWLTTV